MLHSYLCLVESNKQKIKKVNSKTQTITQKHKQLLSGSGFVLCIALPSLSRDRRIKMEENIRYYLICIFIRLSQESVVTSSLRSCWPSVHHTKMGKLRQVHFPTAQQVNLPTCSPHSCTHLGGHCAMAPPFDYAF